MTARLHIDWIRCDGRGLCSELLPRILDRDEWGYPVPRDGSREPAVPPSSEARARAAVARCPRMALSLLVDEPTGDLGPPAGDFRPHLRAGGDR